MIQSVPPFSRKLAIASSCFSRGPGTIVANVVVTVPEGSALILGGSRGGGRGRGGRAGRAGRGGGQGGGGRGGGGKN